MEYAIAIFAFLGGWLILAGSIFQAMLELNAEDVDREGFEKISASVPVPPKISNWWWLLPPVAYLKNRDRNNRYQRAVTSQLAPEQLEGWASFTNKARGWLVVGLGAFLLALRETYELVVLLDWPLWSFFIIAFVSLVLCFVFTAISDHRTNVLLHKEEASAEGRARRRPASPAR